MLWVHARLLITFPFFFTCRSRIQEFLLFHNFFIYFGLCFVIARTAQALDFPFLHPYLQPVGGDFRHGANFTTSGSLAQNNSYSASLTPPFTFYVQTKQFEYFKQQTVALWNNAQNGNNIHSFSFWNSLCSCSKHWWCMFIIHSSITVTMTYLSVVIRPSDFVIDPKGGTIWSPILDDLFLAWPLHPINLPSKVVDT